MKQASWWVAALVISASIGISCGSSSPGDAQPEFDTQNSDTSTSNTDAVDAQPTDADAQTAIASAAQAETASTDQADGVAEIRGTILGPDGNARADVRVWLWRPRPDNEWPRRRFTLAQPPGEPAPPPAWMSIEHVTTNTEGVFVFHDPPPGELRVTGGFGDVEYESQVVAAALVLQGAQRVDLGVMPLGRDREPQRLRFQAQLDGVPVDPGEVITDPASFKLGATFHDVGDWPITGTANGHGFDRDVLVYGLPASRWLITVGGQNKPGFQRGQVFPPTSTPRASIVEMPGARVVIPVDFRTVVNVSLNTTVHAKMPAPESFDAIVFDQDLRMLQRVEQLHPGPSPRPNFYAPAGSYALVIREARPAPGTNTKHVLGVKHFEVSAPGPVDLHAELSAGCTLKGVVLDSQGAPIANVPITLWPAGSMAAAHHEAQLGGARTDHAGAFEITGAPAHAALTLQGYGTGSYTQVGTLLQTGEPGSVLDLGDIGVPEN
ncbi:MAG: hypothetical protein DHS20C15_32730 [Planctomycetota bacterium]|nr:MAG: hypothetical protein DHS20C15_32730 [Planctomycetota bacterium]